MLGISCRHCERTVEIQTAVSRDRTRASRPKGILIAASLFQSFFRRGLRKARTVGKPALHDRGGNCGASSRPPPRDLLRQSGVEGPLRLLALRRDKYQCTMMTCTTPGRGTGGRPIVDHIIERTKGGADDLPNLVHVEISTKTSRDVCNGWRS